MKWPRINWKWAVIIVTVILVAGGLLFGFKDRIDWDAIKDWVNNTNGVLIFALMAVLPLFGFSVGLVYWFAGFRFGPWLGLGVVGAAIAIHLIATYWISNSFLKAPLQRFFARRKYKLPVVASEDHVAVTLLAALIPGLPYALRNYLLALTGVPFRYYFWICWPIYLLRSWIAIFAGDFSMDWELKNLAWIGGILLVKVTICWFLIRRVRSHLKLVEAEKF